MTSFSVSFKYYVCQECPDGLIWNPDTWTCDVCDTNPACDGDDDCA